MVELEKRPIQTKVKHEILHEYLQRWGYIITMGLTGAYYKARQSGRNLSTRFVYVDSFSFMGKYASENNQPVYGSPIIGIEALDKLAANFNERNHTIPETFTILIEEDNSNFEILLNTLAECGYQSRIKQTVDFNNLKPGEIAVINGDYKDYIESILNFTGRDYTWSFFLLDPYGPKGIPLNIVSRVISQQHADGIINLMYQDLHKKTGSAAKEQPDPRHIRLLEHYDAMYGTQTWRQIALRYNQNKIDKENMEDALVELYQNVLIEQDTEVVVKRIPLQFPDKERTMFYLFLTTHDGTGALVMNEILDSEKIKEYDYRQRAKSSKTGQTSMFDLLPDQDEKRPQQVEHNIDEIADTIYQMCKGKTISYRNVLAQLANTSYYLEPVKKGMAKLKREKKCSYEVLNHKELITFR